MKASCVKLCWDHTLSTHVVHVDCSLSEESSLTLAGVKVFTTLCILMLICALKTQGAGILSQGSWPLVTAN